MSAFDGKLGGRVAGNMLEHISPKELIFTCSFLNRLNPEKKTNWESLGVTASQANYDTWKKWQKLLKVVTDFILYPL